MTKTNIFRIRAFIAGVILVIALTPIIIINLQRKIYKPPSRIETIQQEWLLKIKNAEGHSVLIYTEKLGDDIKPLIVRHYARYTETGTIDYWQEVIK